MTTEIASKMSDYINLITTLVKTDFFLWGEGGGGSPIWKCIHESISVADLTRVTVLFLRWNFLGVKVDFQNTTLNLKPSALRLFGCNT